MPEVEANFVLKNPENKFIDSDDQYLSYLKLNQRRADLLKKVQKAIVEKKKHLVFLEDKKQI